MNSFLLLIEIVNDGFCVIMCPSSEDIDVVILAHVGEKLIAIWSNIELELITFMTEFYISFLIGKD